MSLFNNGNYKKLLFSQLINTFGDALTAVALPLYVFSQTQRPADLASLVLIEILTTMICGPILSPLIDRVRRKNLLVFAFLGQGIGIVILGLVDLNLYPLVPYIVAFTNTALFSLSRPALLAYVQDVLEDENQTLQANSYFDALDHVVQAAGAAIAGIMLTTLNAKWAFFLDGTTFFIISGLIITTTTPSAAQQGPANSNHYLKDLKQGLSYLFKHPQLQPLTLIAFCMGAANGGYSALFFSYMKLHLNFSDTKVGLFSALQALAFAAGYYLPSRIQKVSFPYLYCFMFSVSVGAGLFAVSSAFLPALVATTIVCVGISYTTVVTRTMTQSICPQTARGRVLALRRTVLYGGAAVATSLTAKMVTAQSPANLFWAISLFPIFGILLSSGFHMILSKKHA